MKCLIENLEAFLLSGVRAKGFTRVVVGLSGGVDSAVVSTLCARVFGENTFLLIMPSSSSASIHLTHALEFAKILENKFGAHYFLRPIKAFDRVFEEELDIDRANKVDLTRVGNFCARIRMSLLYDFALEQNALVIGTSNKSELLLGYGTIYGDLACAINPIAEIYKSDIFALARELDVLQAIIEKPPSADLMPYQSDEADLGFSYKEIDSLLSSIDADVLAILRYEEFKKSINENKEYEQALIATQKQALISKGFSLAMIDSIFSRISKNAFKLASPLTISSYGKKLICKEEL